MTEELREILTMQNSATLAAITLNGQLTIAGLPAHYERDIKWAQKAGVRTTLQSPNRLTVNVNNVGYLLPAQIEIDLNTAGDWDSIATNYAVAANRAGKDFYIYVCTPESGYAPIIKLSANSTIPTGYTANNSRKIGGFHCLCVAAGVIAGHALTGYLAGDILPASIWDLKHRPKSNPEGMVWSDAAQVWVDIYLVSGTGTSTASVYGGTISDNRNWMDFVDDTGAVKKRLMSDTEFQLIAAGSNEETNIASSADPVTTGGHVDTTARRMISSVGCEDCCGAMHQWLLDQSFRCDPDGTDQAALKTITITYAAAPGGNQIYLKFDNIVPYLCCNMASATADKVVAFGTDYKIIIKHDANAAVGGLPVYFKDNAIDPVKLLVNNTVLSKNTYIQTNNPTYMLKLTHDADAATNGRALNYDDGADNRLECNNIGAANSTCDLALISQGFGYYDLPGSKGSLHRQGSQGDVKLLAGGAWSYGSIAGSRCRSANYSRWITTMDFGGRACAEPAIF